LPSGDAGFCHLLCQILRRIGQLDSGQYALGLNDERRDLGAFLGHAWRAGINESESSQDKPLQRPRLKAPSCGQRVAVRHGSGVAGGLQTGFRQSHEARLKR